MSRVRSAVILLAVLGVARAQDPAPLWKADLKAKDQAIAPVDAVGFSRDGSMFWARVTQSTHVRGGNQSTVVWELDSKKERGRFSTTVNQLLMVGPPMAVNGPADWLASDGAAIVRLALADGKPLKTDFTRGSAIWSIREGESVAASVFGESEGTLTWDGTVDGQSRKLSANLKPHPKDWPVTALAVDGNGRQLATARYSRDQREVTITLDRLERELVLSLSRRAEANASRTGRMSCALFSPDGRRLATGGDDGLVRIWDTANAPEDGWTPKSSVRVTTMSVSAMAFHPNGKYLAFATTNGRTTQAVFGFIDVAAGKVVRQIATPTGLWSVAFSPDGRSLLTGNHLGVVELWDANAILEPAKK